MPSTNIPDELWTMFYTKNGCTALFGFEYELAWTMGLPVILIAHAPGSSCIGYVMQCDIERLDMMKAFLVYEDAVI